MNASTHLLSMNSFQARLATTTDLSINCSAVRHMPLFHSTRNAYSIYEQFLIMPCTTCSETVILSNFITGQFPVDELVVLPLSAAGILKHVDAVF